ncbi:hypothetical protein K470DRAFT_135601 [Piedraia hortae CBS 480.64]|uniref:PHD-type domain-containing protein n=1 Tax=Piedraia hortae CBS 480.64 TaxID=1314780 RepID=A0A6A7BTK4_9PEZI|nr:hypothetical protein K470DRAFT_135601 [Piedraia hortae CBS 480.64]
MAFPLSALLNPEPEPEPEPGLMGYVATPVQQRGGAETSLPSFAWGSNQHAPAQTPDVVMTGTETEEIHGGAEATFPQTTTNIPPPIMEANAQPNSGIPSASQSAESQQKATVNKPEKITAKAAVRAPADPPIYRPMIVTVPTSEPAAQQSVPSPTSTMLAKAKRKQSGAARKKAKNAAAEAAATSAAPSAGPSVPASAAASTRSGASSPAPSADSTAATPSGKQEKYCICHRPDTGSFMIGCDGSCDDWFHGSCVGIAERDRHLIDRFICPNCEGQTTWKRMCRLQSCRQATREGSKYCSDKCGYTFMQEMIFKHGTNPTPIPGGRLTPQELKALVDSVDNVDDWRALGKRLKKTNENTQPIHEDPEIKKKKDAARAKHALLKDRLVFLNLAREDAQKQAEEKGLRAKDYCGYDSRLQWGDDQFAKWREGEAGKKMDLHADRDEDTVCDKKKCGRHNDWPKLFTDQFRYEMTLNGDQMRALEKQEREATLRGR